MDEGWLEQTTARVPLPQKSTRMTKEKSVSASGSFVAIRLAPPMPLSGRGGGQKDFGQKDSFSIFLTLIFLTAVLYP
jgi:hypothetical protein